MDSASRLACCKSPFALIPIPHVVSRAKTHFAPGLAAHFEDVTPGGGGPRVIVVGRAVGGPGKSNKGANPQTWSRGLRPRVKKYCRQRSSTSETSAVARVQMKADVEAATGTSDTNSASFAGYATASRDCAKGSSTARGHTNDW